MKHIFSIAWVAVLELLYEKVFYLLICFALLSLGISLLLGQLTYAEQAKLTLDFMLSAIHLSMILFSIFMGISLFKRELLLGTVSMVLSKPISRASFLLGKYFGQVFVQFVVIICMAVICFLICRRFEGHFSALAIFQAALLVFLEVAVLTAITYFFAVNLGVITTAVTTLILFCLGHLVEGITAQVNYKGQRNWVWEMLKGLLPNLEIFNMKTLAAYGIALSWMEIQWALIYGGIFIVFFLTIASITFGQKDILT